VNYKQVCVKVGGCVYIGHIEVLHGALYCPLCIGYSGCIGCPIGNKYCGDTPYYTYGSYLTDFVDSRLIELHGNMLKYLHNLRREI
jgi:hypothetical protein